MGDYDQEYRRISSEPLPSLDVLRELEPYLAHVPAPLPSEASPPNPLRHRDARQQTWMERAAFSPDPEQS